MDDRNHHDEISASFKPDEHDDDDDDVDEQSKSHPRNSTDSVASTLSRHSLPSAPLAPPSPFDGTATLSHPPVARSTTAAAAAASYVPHSGMDGVFANLAAKPDASSPDNKYDEPLPSYEAAAADAVPPYWETTIITPGMDSDEVYVDGLP